MARNAALPGPGGPDPALHGRTTADVDQTAAESDQTVSDADQSAADADQTASDRDRESARADQLASDRDQVAADEDLDRAFQPSQSRRHAHNRLESERAEITLDRRATALMRAGVARERDGDSQQRLEYAEARDLVAEERDRAADRRDREALALAPELPDPDASPAAGVDAEAALQAAAAARARAAEERRRAAEDRRRAAEDREQAARDREALQAELERAQLDPLTGAFGRAMGEVVLRHELERAKRTQAQLVLAFADVDGLKALNDSEGHAAGDSLLKGAVAALRANLRPYDPIARWGGDEFVCTFSVGTELSAAQRVEEFQQALRKAQPHASMTVGLAALRQDDTLEALLERANAAMRETRNERN